MNICMIPSADIAYESGSTIYAADLCSALADAGHCVHVVCKTFPNRTSEKVFPHLIEALLPHPVIDDYPISDQEIRNSIYALAEKIEEIHHSGTGPLDIVHAHYGTINSTAALLAHIICGIPYVVSCFGRDVFNGAANDKRFERMIAFSLLGARYIICSNEQVREELKSHWQIPLQKMIVLPMPVNTKLFSPTDCLFDGRDKLLTSIVSCLGPEKGIDVTIKAFRKCEVENTKLLIVGQDEHPENKNLGFLQNLVKELGLEGRVLFHGGIPHREIAGILQKTDVLIDSRVVGNYSSVVLEALFSSCLVIASNTPGNRAFVSDNITGFLYDVGDVPALSRKIVRALTDTGLVRKIKRSVKDWTKENAAKYSMDAHIASLISIYANETAGNEQSSNV